MFSIEETLILGCQPRESIVKYLSYCRHLTASRNPAARHCMVGFDWGRPQRVTEACEGRLRTKSFVECNGISLPDARRQVEQSKTVIVIRWSEWKGHRSDKRYAGDNRLIPSKSISTRVRIDVAHHSWGWSRSRFGCSPIKVVELGSDVVRQFGPYLPWV